MANYSFEDLLSPLDFEHLTKDLLSRDLGINLLAFTEGKDKGVDLRYFSNKSKTVIVQCKRKKSISDSELLQEEVKIRKLNPNSYYFVVACDLSVDKVDRIKEIFEEWIQDDSNIYSRNRLNDLLDKYPEIQQKHYKLWVNSSIIFNSLINQPLYERAKALVSSIKKDYKYYVRNESINQALGILNKSQFIIISGIPGIGKTTLARMLLWEYLLNEYEIVEIRKISEGEQILIEDSTSKQVYYFDDFLGENFLKYDVIEGRSNDLIQFIKRIMNNKNKILIMTTREYILKQAKERYEKLNAEELDLYKYTLDISTYSKKNKALILYNHLYYSGISHKHIQNVIKNRTYKKIIEHKNYSPRIIEQMTVFLQGVKPDDYSKVFIQNLNHPFGIWDKAINSQISEAARFILFILLSIGEPILLSDFKKVIAYFHDYIAKAKGIDFKIYDYKIYLKELEGCFIRIDITSTNNHFITFQNPSIKDFLLYIIREDKEIISTLLSSVLYFNQLEYIINYMIDSFYQDAEIHGLIKNIILEKFDSLGRSSTILSTGTEINKNINDLEKIKALSPYINKVCDDQLFTFIIGKFNLIDLKQLPFYQEKQYIDFLKENRDRIGFDFNELINSIFSSICWKENVKNFLSLKELDETEYQNFVSNRKEEIRDTINKIFEKEIDYFDTPESLNDLSLDFALLKIDIEDIASIDFDYFDKTIDYKIKEIESKKETTPGKEDIEVDDFERGLHEDNYNADELFTEEMFS